MFTNSFSAEARSALNFARSAHTLKAGFVAQAMAHLALLALDEWGTWLAPRNIAFAIMMGEFPSEPQAYCEHGQASLIMRER